MRSAIAYREQRASASLARYIECFWTIEAARDPGAHVVLPDGCADILFTISGSGRAESHLIGGMTIAQNASLSCRQRLFGVRFRPGMWSLFLRAPWPELTDRNAPLGQIVDKPVTNLLERLVNSESMREMACVTEAWLGEPRKETAVQHVAELLAREHGQARVEDLSDAAGISSRQLRRLFVEQTGLTPKQLARILRFSAERLRSDTAGAAAQVALECGYYDQAHFINEFRAFSGSTPADYQARAV